MSHVDVAIIGSGFGGCACDVQSHLFSFSFAPNPDSGSTATFRRRVARFRPGEYKSNAPSR